MYFESPKVGSLNTIERVRERKLQLYLCYTGVEHWKDEKCLQNFDRKTWKKESAGKSYTL